MGAPLGSTTATKTLRRIIKNTVDKRITKIIRPAGPAPAKKGCCVGSVGHGVIFINISVMPAINWWGARKAWYANVWMLFLSLSLFLDRGFCVHYFNNIRDESNQNKQTFVGFLQHNTPVASAPDHPVIKAYTTQSHIYKHFSLLAQTCFWVHSNVIIPHGNSSRFMCATKIAGDQ